MAGRRVASRLARSELAGFRPEFLRTAFAEIGAARGDQFGRFLRRRRISSRRRA